MKYRIKISRISIRTLMIFVTLVCLILATWVTDIERKKRATAWIRRANGLVTYDYQIGFDPADQEEFINGNAYQPWPMISNVIGVEYFSDVKYVDLSFTAIRDVGQLKALGNIEWLALGDSSAKDISAISGLKKLKSLELSGVPIDGLEFLENLNRLEFLSVSNLRSTDLSPLGSLSNLKTLHLLDVHSSDFSPLGRLTELRTLDLDGSTINDLSPLYGLKRLRLLILTRTPTNTFEIDFLKLHLPNCRVEKSDRIWP